MNGIVDAIAGEQRLGVEIGQHHPGHAQPLIFTVTLEEMVANEHMPGAVQHGEMGKAHDAVIADLGVIGVDVDRDRAAGSCARIACDLAPARA